MVQVINEEKPFPDDLEGRLAAVVNAVNTEFKTITLLHLDDVPADKGEIRRRLRETVGRKYLPKGRAFGGYGNTFYDVALVAKQTVVRDEGDIQSIGYSLTEAGRKFGLPIANSTLRYAVDTHRSMFHVLGPTNSRGNSRAPYNRIKILEELRKVILRERDLVAILGLTSSDIQEHLLRLQKIGFVQFESVGSKTKGKFLWRWKGNNEVDVRTVNRRNSTTKKVANYLMENPGFVDRDRIAEQVGYKYLNVISEILVGLEEQGVVERERWKKKEFLSEIVLSNDGRRFLDEWVVGVEGILSEHSELNPYASLYDDETFRDYCMRGLETYKRISPYVNKKPLQERLDNIRKLLAQHPNLTSREISNLLNSGIASVIIYLRILKHEIKSTKQEQEVRYSLKSSTR